VLLNIVIGFFLQEKNPIYKDCVTDYKNPMCEVPPNSDGVDGGDEVMFRKR
jgi:hypothetical protein